MSRRLVVVGGDAGGMSCAAMVKRRDPDLEVIAFERGEYTSYSQCGIPYFVGGTISEAHDLVLREADEHRKRGIDVRLGWEVTEIDLDARRVHARRVEDGEEITEGFDTLMYATGAEAVIPDIPGAREATEPLKTIAAAERFRRGLARSHDRSRAVVVGGGYIGLEVAEALAHRGNEVVLLEAGPQLFPTLDPDMAEHVQRAAEDAGIEVRLGVEVEAVEHEDGIPRAVITGDGSIEARHVLLAVGQRPAVGLAREAGLAVGDTGALAVDEHQRAGDGIWAAGDCVESWHRLLQRQVNIALGTHANKQGRVAAVDMTGGEARFPGVIGTAISRICTAEVARTGLTEREAHDAGIAYATATVETETRASYWPTSEPMWIKLLAEPGSGRLLGGQIVGGASAGKRIDVLATAIWTGMAADELAWTDLSYAPPFSGTFDPVQIAARAVAKEAGSDRS